MNGDYLWDRSGPPDPEIQRLEAILRPLRRLPPASELPVRRPRAASWFDRATVAAAAAVLVALAAARGHNPSIPAMGEGWDLRWLEGVSPSDSLLARHERLRPGEWVETRGKRARLSVGEIGQVELEPATRLGLIDDGSRWHRLSLARGVIHATIWAPPGRFVVDTPSALAVDLGCRYTLAVEADGSGLLHVEAGWVGVEHGRLRSLVPAGAACRTRRGLGPGVPYYASATPALREALRVLDLGPPEAQAAALERALAEARLRDALSLIHLLPRVGEAERGRVFDRLAELVPPPEGVTREGVVGGDSGMRDLWWAELGLGSAEFWRNWTSPWSSLGQETTRQADPSSFGGPSRR